LSLFAYVIQNWSAIARCKTAELNRASRWTPRDEEVLGSQQLFNPQTADLPAPCSLK
jgi:hypothetical protein